MKRLFNIIFVVAVIFFVACEKDTSQPGYQIKPLIDMVYPIPYEAHSKNQVFADGLTNQTPPKGTIHRDQVLEDPFDGKLQTMSSKDLARGKFVYENYCQMCHGPQGDGDGQLIPRYPNPPSFSDKRLINAPIADLFNAVSNGKRDMPAHAGQIEASDRWRVVYYVQKLMGKESQNSD